MKKTVLIIFGGRSGEHEVSVKSALSIEKAIDKKKFSTHCLGITHDGVWHYGKSVEAITSGGKVLPPTQMVSLPAKGDAQNTLEITTKTGIEFVHTDCIFPIIHGTNGEDGRLQGLLEIANLPYVGSGVLGSAVCMDKVTQKIICGHYGIPQTPFHSFTQTEWNTNKDSVMSRIQSECAFPLFVKPSNLGSSVGIQKVKTVEALEPAIAEALQFDRTVIVEQGVPDMIEIEVSVIGNEHPEASVCGAIIPHTEFYDYETKYITDDIDTQIPAEIPQAIADKIRKMAVQTFSVLQCKGLARVDFFYQPSTGEVFLNEINTLPGFTSISMYPKLWEASGLPYSELITSLIELGFEEWEAKQKLRYTFDEK